jgi:aminoglycoside phosphotransferase (APT) family kinase protein
VTCLDLPPELGDWVESVVGSPLIAAHRHLAGASRQAWSIDAGAHRLFLLRDTVGGGGGCSRDATVLRALAGTPVPVPAVWANEESLGTVLLERVPGRSDFPPPDCENEWEPTARHMMEVTAALHRLDPSQLPLCGLLGSGGGDNGTDGLADLARIAAEVDDHDEPLFSFALDWLHRHRPAPPDRPSLVHSDMGPGNFLFQNGRVTAVVDWEVAHLGDPMEDLAAISIRDMATPIGRLASRFQEYRDAGGAELDLNRIQFFRIFVLTRNTLLLAQTLAQPTADMDVARLSAYRMLLSRAAALVLCDATGARRPAPEADEFGAVVDVDARRRPGPARDADTAAWLARRAHRQAATLGPALGDLLERMPQPLAG